MVGDKKVAVLLRIHERIKPMRESRREPTECSSLLITFCDARWEKRTSAQSSSKLNLLWFKKSNLSISAIQRYTQHTFSFLCQQIGKAKQGALFFTLIGWSGFSHQKLQAPNRNVSWVKEILLSSTCLQILCVAVSIWVQHMFTYMTTVDLYSLTFNIGVQLYLLMGSSFNPFEI